MIRFGIIIPFVLLATAGFGQAPQSSRPTTARTSRPAWSWVTGETAVIVRVDLRSEVIQKTVATMQAGQGGFQVPGLAPGILKRIDKVLKAGAVDVCLALTGDDIDLHECPLLIIGIDQRTDARAIKQCLVVSEDDDISKPPFDECLETPDALIFGTKAQIEASNAAKRATRLDVDEARAMMADCFMQVLVFGTKPLKKKLATSLPAEMPKELGGAAIKSLLDSVSWAAVGIALADNDTKPLRLIVRVNDDMAAKAMHELAVKAAGKYGKDLSEEFPELAKSIGSLSPVLDKVYVRIELENEEFVAFYEAVQLTATRDVYKHLATAKAENVAGALVAYSKAQDTKLPGKLSDLVKEGFVTKEQLASSLLPREDVAYIYLAPKATDGKIPPGRMVLHQKFDKWKFGVPVVTADGSVRFVANQDVFNRLLEEAQVSSSPK